MRFFYPKVIGSFVSSLGPYSLSYSVFVMDGENNEIIFMANY